MFTIIGADGKEYGPVTADNIRDWITAGRANLQTKARRDGDTEWKALADFPEFSAAVPPPMLPAAVAGQPVTPDAFTGSPAEIAARLAPNAQLLDIGACMSNAFTTWKENLLPLIGVSVLVFIVQMVLGFIPLVSMFSSLLLGNVFAGGLYYYYLGKARGEPRTVGDAFAGFSKAFLQLMLSNLITVLIVMTIMLLFAGPFFFSLFKAAASGALDARDFSGLSPLALVFFLLGLIPLFYLSVSWILTVPLIIDRGLNAWTAMEVSRRVISRCWFRIFLLLLCSGLVSLLGLIGLIIGIIVTVPLGFAFLVHAYEDLSRPPLA